MMGFARAQPILRPYCDLPVEKSLLAMTLANIVARMERSEIRDSRDAGPGLRFAPSGLQPLTIRPAQVICPSGSLLTGVSSPICKNISVPTHPKSHLELFPSWPERGAYHDRHGRWGGMRWTRQR